MLLKNWSTPSETYYILCKTKKQGITYFYIIDFYNLRIDKKTIMVNMVTQYGALPQFFTISLIYMTMVTVSILPGMYYMYYKHVI